MRHCDWDSCIGCWGEAGLEGARNVWCAGLLSTEVSAMAPYGAQLSALMGKLMQKPYGSREVPQGPIHAQFESEFFQSYFFFFP